MVNDTMGLLELVRKAEGTEDLDFMREALRFVCQELIDAEATAAIGAGHYERTDERTTHRNGSRARSLDTRVGTLDLSVPKLRSGSFFPSILEPRRRIERALWSVVCEAYVNGVSTRRVDELVKAMGSSGISRSEVRRICMELDASVEAFRNRPLTGTWPYCGWMRPPIRCGRLARSSTSRPWSRSRSTPMGCVASWASTSARARTTRSGCRSFVRSRLVACRVPSW